MRMPASVALIFVLMIGQAYANDAPVTREQALKNCKTISDLARSIMDGRQAGVQMSLMMEAVADIDVGQTLVAMAFEHQRYSSDDGRERATVDFENEVYAACFKWVPQE